MNPADRDTNYAVWTDPQNRFSVTYSLNVFHEIDFEVSEGFRRIPHGGVEIGGVLFGKLRQEGGRNALEIEAFRPIECEHATGPSFQLSERDLAGLRNQLAGAATDPELAGMEILGWFVAHTRSPLAMNEREAQVFAEFFPGPGKLLTLVKPERFQATKFSFLVRGTDGQVDRDGSAMAIILPLPGRAGRTSNAPAASIPAPEASAPGTRGTGRRLRALGRGNYSHEALGEESAPPSFWHDLPEPGSAEPIVRIEEPAGLGADPPAYAPPRELSSAEAVAGEDIREQIKRARIARLQAGSPGVDEPPITRRMRRERGPSLLRLISLLMLAAGLGSAVGYLAYLQLPSATIPVTVRQGATPGLIVSWPAEETRDAIFASISVNNGDAIPLSTPQKNEGRVTVPATGDNIKIEVFAQRRWRDSRGIVRYVTAEKASRP